jgi:hypothetical protein
VRKGLGYNDPVGGRIVTIVFQADGEQYYNNMKITGFLSLSELKINWGLSELNTVLEIKRH